MTRSEGLAPTKTGETSTAQDGKTLATQAAASPVIIRKSQLTRNEESSPSQVESDSDSTIRNPNLPKLVNLSDSGMLYVFFGAPLTA